MRKKIAVNALYVSGISAFVASIGCGGAIEQASSGWCMVGWLAAGLLFLALSAVLMVAGRQMEASPEHTKIHKDNPAAVKPGRGRRAG